MKGTFLAAFLLSGLALPMVGQEVEGRWYLGGQIQVGLALDAQRPSLAQDLHDHLASGLGLSLGWRVSERQELRATLDYTGTRVASWSTPASLNEPEKRVHDIWRSFRFGADHVLSLRPEEGPYAFYGAGIRNAWVARTEGSLLEATLLSAVWALGGSSSNSNTVDFQTRSTALESWRPYLSAGLGWRFSEAASLELRYVGGNYLRDASAGLRTAPETSTEERMGHQLFLSFGLRSGCF